MDDSTDPKTRKRTRRTATEWRICAGRTRFWLNGWKR